MYFNKTLKAGIIAVAAAGVFGAGQASAADNTLVWPSRYSFKDWDPAATYSEETLSSAKMAPAGKITSSTAMVTPRQASV